MRLSMATYADRVRTSSASSDGKERSQRRTDVSVRTALEGRIGSPDVLGDLPGEVRLRHGADHGVHVAAVLEEHQRGNRAYVEPHRHLLIRVHVHLRDLEALGAELPGELVEHRRDDPARAAPLGPEFDDREALV